MNQRPDRVSSEPSMDLEAGLDRYARILVEHGAGVVPGQHVYVSSETAHRDLVLRVAEAAYDAGASSVSTSMSDPYLVEQLIRRADTEHIELAIERERSWINECVARGGALISLRGEEAPRLMPDLATQRPERHAVYTRASSQKSKVFMHHGINRSLCPWVVAGAVSEAWAQLVFPDLPSAEASAELWRHVFAFTHADREDAVEAAAAKDRCLHARRRLLGELQIREIRVVGGESDLRVGFSNKARWLGGSKQTASGQTFNANVPSEENFTTPDRRKTEGRLAATMPFRTKSGLLVEGLVMDFVAGRIERVQAKSGGESFERWIDSDAGGRFLGEFALVGQDSPIAQSGLFFEHTLYDENAWPHVAVGQAYATAIEGGESMSESDKAAIGCNASTIHTDIMFGSPEVSVIATETREGEVTLIDNGHWTERFLEPAVE
ncbi:MAG: aminopeptidase [Acidobacteriota bacterium]